MTERTLTNLIFWLTLRLSCGARMPPPSTRGPPARRQLQPVVSWLHGEGLAHVGLKATLSTNTRICFRLSGVAFHVEHSTHEVSYFGAAATTMYRLPTL